MLNYSSFLVDFDTLEYSWVKGYNVFPYACGLRSVG